MERLAQHYGAGDGSVAPAAEDGGEGAGPRDDLGRRLAVDGISERQVPACAGCHGLEDGPRDGQYPTLAGQYSSFIVEQLQLWKEGRRGSGAYTDIMAPIASRLTADEMETVARYYESLSAER
jgi:cytochrome c553